MDSFFQSLARLGPLRLAAILGITAGVTIALILMASGMGKAQKSLLYTELSLKEAGEITSRLDQMNVAYELRNGGTAIFVERDKIQTTKMTLAADNLPTSASIGYDIFDQAASMGQTSFSQNISKLRALQGELERTISTIKGVEAARVLLVLPERQLFQTNVEQAKASVTIKLGANSIGFRQTNAIRHLVASAVPGLMTSGVTVVDDTGRVLAGGNDDDGQSADPIQHRAGVEDSLRLKIERVLSTIVGPGGVTVQLNAEMDQNRVTERSTIYDPDGQVVISSDTSIQNSNEQDASNNGSVTVGENMPGTTGTSGDNPASSNVASTEKEILNYGVSKTETTKVYQVGTIKRLSIAVNVDGITTMDADGNSTWTARSSEEMAQIEALVKSAVGFDASRGDILQVTNLKFSKPEPLSADEAVAKPGFNKNDIMRIIELFILGLVSVVMIFFLGRPLISALIAGGGSGAVIGGNPALAVAGDPGASVMPQLPGSSGGANGQVALPSPDGALDVEEQGFDISKIDGQVKASSIKQVAGIVDSHPEESVSILRNWLHEA